MYRYSISIGNMPNNTFVEAWVMHKDELMKHRFELYVDAAVEHNWKLKPHYDSDYLSNSYYLAHIREYMCEHFGFQMPPESVHNYYVEM